MSGGYVGESVDEDGSSVILVGRISLGKNFPLRHASAFSAGNKSSQSIDWREDSE